MIKKVEERRKLSINGRIYILTIYKTFFIFKWAYKYVWDIEENEHIIYFNRTPFDTLMECQKNIKDVSNVIDPFVITYML